MTDAPDPRPWPAAQRGGATIIQHPAWEEARNAVLDLAAEGPVTVALVGAAGTGKTWLLRELAGCLGDHGFPTMMLMQGDLPLALSEGAALLVDEALRMPDPVRAEMAAQRRGVVVLADLERLEPVVEALPPGPVLIGLRTLEAEEVAAFASEWLRLAGVAGTLDAGGLARLTAHSGGTVRLIVQLLTAAVARHTGDVRLGGTLSGELIDEVAELRLGGLNPSAEAVAALPEPAFAAVAVPEPASLPVAAKVPVFERAPMVVPPRRRRRSVRKWALAGSAIAAGVLGWAFLPGSMPLDGSAPPSTETAPPALPPIQRAEIAAPAANSTPSTAEAPEPAARAGLPPLREAEIPLPAPASEPLPAEPAAIASPLPAPVPDAAGTSPAAVAALPIPPVAAAPAPRLATSRRRGTAGLALVAQRGDTLERLYDDIYRNRQAPPYEDVLAANPQPFKPGVIVVFPEPPGGWNRVQR